MISTIYDFLTGTEEHPELTIPFLVAAGAISVIWILAYNSKETIIRKITHRRNRVFAAFLTIIFFLLMLIALDRSHFHVTMMWWITAFLWLISLLLFSHDLKPKMIVTGDTKAIYHNYLFRDCAAKIREGKADEYVSAFETSNLDSGRRSLAGKLVGWSLKHTRLLDSDARIEALFLKLQYLILWRDDIEEAYKALKSVDEGLLYLEELEEVLIKMAMCLAYMGNISAAKAALERAHFSEQDKNDLLLEVIQSPEVWIIYAFIAEQSGEFDKAYKYAIKAKDYVEISNISDDRKAIVLNDCARYEIIHGDRIGADKDIKNAWEHIKKSNSRVRESIGINVIQLMIQYGYPEEQVMAVFDELKGIHDPGNINLDILFYNIKITILRQFNKDQECYDTIKQFCSEIKERLPDAEKKSQLECIKATVFHQLMDGEYDYSWLDKDIVTDPTHYKDLNVYDKTFIFQHYYQILSQYKYKYVRSKEPYNKIYEIALSYYKGDGDIGSAVDEIDKELEICYGANINKQIELRNRKLYALSIRDGCSHIDNNLGEYRELKKYLDDAGLKLEALNVYVQIVIAASGFDYIQVMDMNSGRSSTYAEYLDTAPVFIPKLNGIHMEYVDPVGADPWVVPTGPKDISLIKEHTEKAIEEIRKLQNHPFKAEVSLMLLRGCMGMNMDTEAKELYSYAVGTGKSDDTLASWARTILDDVRKIYG